MTVADGDITIPGTKSRVSRPVAYAGLAAVGVLIIIYYRKQKAAATATPAATPTDQYPPDGTSGNPGDPYSTDPATGQTYGNEAAGSGGTYGAYGSGAASGNYYDPATGAYDLTSPYGTTPTTQPYQVAGGPPFSSNSAWADWVIQELQAQNASIDVGGLTGAIGLYLNGQPLDAAQRAYVFDAKAIGGDPPVAGPNGYPPKLQGSGSTGPVSPLKPPGPVTGFSVTGHKGFADFGWAPDPTADNYNLVISGPQPVNRQTGPVTHQEHVVLKPGHYTAKVRGNNHGAYGPFTAARAFTVT